MAIPSTAEFERLMGALEDWHCDGVQAQTYDGPTSHGELGHVILTKQPYPGPNWRVRWQRATANQDLVAQATILRALEDELYGLDHGPSLASPAASGLYPGTLQWKRTVAAQEGSLRAVSRRFGVSHTTVRALRLEYR